MNNLENLIKKIDELKEKKIKIEAEMNMLQDAIKKKFNELSELGIKEVNDINELEKILEDEKLKYEQLYNNTLEILKDVENKLREFDND